MADLVVVGPRSAAILMLLIQALASCSSRESPLVISEFLAANASGLTDRDGDTSDWIELHNRGDAAVNLAGWCLTDDPHKPDRWRFPALQLPAKAFLLVFASGKDVAATSDQLHTTFRLKATSDYLALLRPGGRVVHEFNPYPDQKVDVSFGLTRLGKVDYLSHPTPGQLNGESRSSAAAPGKEGVTAEPSGL
jgi:hypothetical protein